MVLLKSARTEYSGGNIKPDDNRENFEPNGQNMVSVAGKTSSRTFDSEEDSSRSESNGSQATETCPGCSTGIRNTDMALCCNLCDMWHHIACEGINKEVYKFLTGNEESTIHWYCAKCNVVVGKLVKQVTKLSNRQDYLETRMHELELKTEEQHQELRQEITTVASSAATLSKEEVKVQVGEALEHERLSMITEAREMVRKEVEDIRMNQDKWLKDIKDKVYNEVKSTLKGDLEQAYKEVIGPDTGNTTGAGQGSEIPDTRALRRGLTELDEIESRKKNLIVVNLPETNTEEGDKEAVRDLLREEFGLTPEIAITERLGTATDGRVRLLRIKLETLTDKKQILAKASALRNSRSETHKRVFIRPDMTRNQLQEQKNLRQELARRRHAQPHRHWFIKRGMVLWEEPQH